MSDIGEELASENLYRSFSLINTEVYPSVQRPFPKIIDKDGEYAYIDVYEYMHYMPMSNEYV